MRAILVSCLTPLLLAGLPAHAQSSQPASTPAAAPAATPATQSISTSLKMVVFPGKGQTPQQQSQDEGECYTWSKGQTGVDPMAPAPAPAPAATAAEPAKPAAGGTRIRGAARGAAAGAVIGEVANGEANEGAAIGATAGVLKGGAEARRNKKEAEAQATEAAQQQTAQQQAAQQQQVDLFRKGFAACLEGKGYTVK